MRATIEREVKLEAGAGFRLPDLPGDEIGTRSFVSTYHDTPDLRLAAAGITLRHRVELEVGLWQLKLPHPGGRLELEVPGGGDHVPTEIATLLTAHARRAPLEPVAALHTERVGVRVRDGELLVAEVVRDTVAVLGGAADHRFEELEIVLLDGDSEALARLETLLRDAGAYDGDGRPKLFRALDIHRPTTRPARHPKRPVDKLRAALASNLAVIVASDAGTRLGTDPEHLHQHRVAARRLRAVLRAAGPMVDRRWADDLRRELAWLGQALGPVRDLDVMIEHLREEVATLGEGDGSAAEPLLSTLDSDHERARAAMLGALGEPRYLDLLDALERAAANPAIVDPDASLERRARREYRRLRRAVRAAGGDPADATLHRLRIQVKRTRYAAELASPRTDRWNRILEACKHLQEVLGTHQDACVAEAQLRELARIQITSATLLATGRLIERQAARQAASRGAYPEAWAALKAAARRTWG
jgi:CHAD domain-containing protein